MYSVLGWINVILLLFMASMFPIKSVLKKKKSMVSLYRFFRKLHPIIGVSIVLIGMIHGYLALGGVRLHSGSILLLSIALSGGIIYSKGKINYMKHNWRRIHRTLGFVIIALLILHLAFPNYI